ncbi:carboxyl ester lipase-like protein Gli [Arctopsyche grandis]|uniref:carboxyl ester lipase-like protein Gli n=1 Tax=Arctopsyche grandis TaxID=121162 RepID=UPI00406D77F2
MGVVAAAVWLSLASWVAAQSDPGSSGRVYNKDGVYIPPKPGDSDYRTYTYNSRRYGHYQPTGTQYNQYYPQYPPQQGGYPFGQNTPLDDRFRNNMGRDPSNPDAVFPGVLGGWREDLQGKERRDSKQLPRDIFVTTNYGQVQGFKVYMYDNPDPDSGYRPWTTPVERIQGEASVFLGIPYAIPPVLDGRFKPPRPHRGWQLLQAVDFGPACPQPVRYTGATKGVRDMDEDCLYLNVYSPNTEAGVPQKYPVMVYIHGGDFYKGASNTFPAHIMAAFYNVVVVSINYRLGALGFISTADSNSPGNYGILDQALALKWIHDNVEFFNGDRNSITLFGPGAGAASAGLLMVAPQTKNLVNKVIAQSGSALAEWSMIIDKYRAQNTSRVYGQLLGCSIESSWKLINCLKQRNFYELGNAEFQPHVGLFPWGPVLDVNFTYPGDDWYEGWHESDWLFLKETPEELIRKGHFNRGLSYMSGVTLQEAAYVIYENETLAPHYEIDSRFFSQKVKELVLRYNYTLNPLGVYEAIKYMYTYWPDPYNKTHIREQYIHLLSDFFFRAPSDNIIKLLLDQKVPVYIYVMNTTVEALNLPEWRKVPHNIELYFLTGAPFMDIEFFPSKWKLQREMWTPNDRNMSHFFMKAYTDFARFGNPTRQQILGLHFELAGAGELKYLNVNTTYNSTILLNFRQTECAFWSQYLPTVVGHFVPTYPPVTEFWWEPKEPLQIAFWSMSAACLLLVVMLVVCCLLWRQAKREADRCYSGDIFMVHETGDEIGIENTNRSRENVYEYRDKPIRPQTLSLPSRPSSQASSGSGLSLKEGHYVSSSPNPNGRSTPPPKPRVRQNIKTQLVQGVPQTQV